MWRGLCSLCLLVSLPSKPSFSPGIFWTTGIKTPLRFRRALLFSSHALQTLSTPTAPLQMDGPGGINKASESCHSRVWSSVSIIWFKKPCFGHTGCPQMGGAWLDHRAGKSHRAQESKAALPFHRQYQARPPGRVAGFQDGGKNLSTCRAVIEFPFLICRVVMTD